MILSTSNFNFMDLYKERICDEVIHLTPADRKEILKIVKRHNPAEARKYPDGTRIKLDNLTDSVNKQIYELIKRKLNLSE
jgi:hypothetical protein